MVVQDCVKCGFTHQLPIPTEEVLAQGWRDLYQSDTANLLEQESKDQWYWRLVYRERLRWFDTLHPPSPDLSILDYGAGLGHFVAYCNERDVYTWGYEPYTPIAGMQRYMVSHLSDLNPDLPRQFNGVHCALVLEHVRRPHETLAQIRDLLCDRGVLCLIVPNEFNPYQNRLTMETGYSPFHPSHVNYFTKDSIINLLHDTGFIVNLGFSTFPMERLALSGLDYVRRPRLGLVAHWVRMLYEARLMIFNPNRLLQIRGNWYRLGIGREIELWARKV